MSATLQIGDEEIAVESIIPLLERYQLLPQLKREMIIDRAIAPMDCTDEEIASVRQQLPPHPEGTGVPTDEAIARWIRLQKFKQAQWQHKLDHYFLQRKTQLDQVIYSLIQTQDADVANELYFRLLEGEQSFAELAAQYSQGPEAAKSGLVGPVEIGAYHPSFAHVLATRAPGELVAPLPLEDCVVIIRIEQKIPARFDEATQQRLLDELFAAWLDAEL